MFTQGMILALTYSDVDLGGFGELVLLGTPFLRRWYSVYNLGTNSVGLAQSQ